MVAFKKITEEPEIAEVSWEEFTACGGSDFPDTVKEAPLDFAPATAFDDLRILD